MKRTLLYALVMTITLSVTGQNTINSPFFDQVGFRGAFGSSNDWTQGWANWDPQNTNYGAATITVEGELTSNTTWTADKVYLIKGFYYVRDGVTLTIEPGTLIRGDKDTKGTLLIERGAKLIANGTQSQPIVFTSNQNAGNRGYGDWGGIVLCGKGALNVPGGTAIIEGGPTSVYGGGANPDDTDNSGSLKFIRIEFPGVPFVPDKEINGLTLGAVGSGTTIDYVQVSYCGDDSYEWFGGMVNAKHLIAFRGWDDDFDTDYGYRGMIQFAVALRDKDIADPGSGSNGFESDNDGSGSTNTPITNPIFSNVSVFGPKYSGTTSINSNFKRSMHLRRNTRLNVYNSVFSGFPTGLFIDGTAAQGNATNGDLKMERCVLSGMGSFFAGTFERTFFTTASRGNDTLASNDLMKYVDPFNLSQPNFLLQNSSKLISGSIWGTVGIETLEKESIITLYPNPANQITTLSFSLDEPSVVAINIFSMNGKKELSVPAEQFTNGQHSVALPIENLKAGLYFITVNYNHKVSTIKMVKK